MKPTKTDVVALSDQQFEALFVLASYHRAIEFLPRESILYIDLVAEADAAEQSGLFHTSARIWHGLWVASVYVAHEGFEKLDIQDGKLNRIRAQVRYRFGHLVAGSGTFKISSMCIHFCSAFIIPVLS